MRERNPSTDYLADVVPALHAERWSVNVIAVVMHPEMGVRPHRLSPMEALLALVEASQRFDLRAYSLVEVELLHAAAPPPKSRQRYRESVA